MIPVSGGKDSTWQVITALKYNLKPLCVTWKTPVRSKIGIQNLENLIKLGVDHYDVTINPDVEKYFCYKLCKIRITSNSNAYGLTFNTIKYCRKI